MVAGCANRYFVGLNNYILRKKKSQGLLYFSLYIERNIEKKRKPQSRVANCDVVQTARFALLSHITIQTGDKNFIT